MAKFKKTATGKTANRGGGKAQAQAERLSNTLSESAQQIWLAGVGAFGRAQAEGHKLFEALVKEGLSLEKTARGFAGGRADFVRDAVENHVGQARERATDTWDKLEKVFESRVSRALGRLGVPGSQELKALTTRVEELAREVHKLNTKATPKAGATRSVARVKDELADVARELESAQLDQAKAGRTASAKKPAVKKPAAKKAPAGKAKKR